MKKVLFGVFLLLALSKVWAQPGPVRTKPLSGSLISAPGAPRGTQVNVSVFLEFDSTWMQPYMAGLVASLTTDQDARFMTQLPIFNRNRMHVFNITYRNCSGMDVSYRLFANPNANSFQVYLSYCINLPPPCSPEFVFITDTLANPVATICNFYPLRQSRDLDSCYGVNRKVRWTIDNQVVDTINRVLRHAFYTGGQKRVCLNITNTTTNQTHQFCRTIEVGNRCNLPIRFSYSGHDSVHQFNISPNVPANVPVIWNLGNGIRLEGQNVTHRYRQVGRYNVCAEARFSPQCVVTWCDSVEVLPAPGRFSASVVVQGQTGNFMQGFCDADSVIVEAFGINRARSFRFAMNGSGGQRCRFNISLPFGNYVLKATPLGASRNRYLPTYGSQSLNWLEAQAINSPGEYVIDLLPRRFIPLPQDSGMLKGFVIGLGNLVTYRDPDTEVNYQIPFNPDRATLQLSNANKELIELKPLNPTGIFEFDNLPDGNYWLTLEHPLVVPVSVKVNIQHNVMMPLVQFTIQEQGISVISSINKPISQNFKVYPNPATEFVSIEPESSVEFATICDLAGKIIFQTSRSKIDISTLKNGLYIVKVKTHEGQLFSTRLTKN